MILTKLKGMAMPEQVEAPEHKLEELKRVIDALWESLDHRVGNLEAKMDDDGSRCIMRTVKIEKAQEQLGDTIKALTRR